MKSLLLIVFLASVNCNPQDVIRRYSDFCYNDPRYNHITPSMEYSDKHEFLFKNRNFPHGVILKQDDVMNSPITHSRACFMSICNGISSTELTVLVTQFNQLLLELRLGEQIKGQNQPSSQKIVKMGTFPFRQLKEAESNLPKVCSFEWPNQSASLHLQVNPYLKLKLSSMEEATLTGEKYYGTAGQQSKSQSEPLPILSKTVGENKYQSPKYMTNDKTEMRSDEFTYEKYKNESPTVKLSHVKKIETAPSHHSSRIITGNMIESRSNKLRNNEFTYKASTNNQVLPAKESGAVPMQQSKIYLPMGVMEGRDVIFGDDGIYDMLTGNMLFHRVNVDSVSRQKSLKLMKDYVVEGRYFELDVNKYIDNAPAYNLFYSPKKVNALPMHQSKILMKEGVVEGRNNKSNNMGYAYPVPSEKLVLPTRRRRSVIENDVTYYTDDEVQNNGNDVTALKYAMKLAVPKVRVLAKKAALPYVAA